MVRRLWLLLSSVWAVGWFILFMAISAHEATDKDWAIFTVWAFLPFIVGYLIWQGASFVVTGKFQPILRQRLR